MVDAKASSDIGDDIMMYINLYYFSMKNLSKLQFLKILKRWC